ncbi:MAG: SUMF1/EgtB/PvdO family nonheme iron enzyme, partial [Cellulosimicrobium cellulans]
MGSDRHYPEEGPAHDREVAPFLLERHAVTNAQYAAFVADTGYVTVAERALDPADFPGADPADLVPGGLVFTPTAGPVDLRD